MKDSLTSTKSFVGELDDKMVEFKKETRSLIGCLSICQTSFCNCVVITCISFASQAERLRHGFFQSTSLAFNNQYIFGPYTYIYILTCSCNFNTKCIVT